MCVSGLAYITAISNLYDHCSSVGNSALSEEAKKIATIMGILRLLLVKMDLVSEH